MDQTFILAQICGVIGYGFYALSPLMKDRWTLLAVEALGCAIVALHWVILELPTVALMNAVYVYIGIISIQIEKHPKAKYGLHLSFPILFLLTALGWQDMALTTANIAATIVGIGATAITVASKYCLDLAKLRLLSAISALLWVICGIIAVSIPQIIACMLFMIGHIHELRKLKKAQSHA